MYRKVSIKSCIFVIDKTINEHIETVYLDCHKLSCQKDGYVLHTNDFFSPLHLASSVFQTDHCNMQMLINHSKYTSKPFIHENKSNFFCNLKSSLGLF